MQILRRSAMGSIVVTAVLASGQVASGAVLAEYTFDNSTNGVPDTLDLADSAAAAVLTANDLVIGAGLGPAADPVTNNGGGPQTDGVNVDNQGGSRKVAYLGTYTLRAYGGFTNESNVGDAITANDYLSIVLTPDPGMALDLTDFTYKFSTNNNNNTPEDFFVTVDGTQIGAVQTVNNDSPGYIDVTFDLTSVANLSAATDIRLYLFGSGGGSGIRHAQLDSLTVNGEVVPEPATLLLVSLGAAGMFIRSRSGRQRV